MAQDRPEEFDRLHPRERAEPGDDLERREHTNVIVLLAAIAPYLDRLLGVQCFRAQPKVSTLPRLRTHQLRGLRQSGQVSVRTIEALDG
jgi:hypothetical protein